MEDQEFVIFDNLRQADNQIAGQTRAIKAVRPTAAHFSQPNAKGALYFPGNLEDVAARADKAADRFCEMFQSAL